MQEIVSDDMIASKGDAAADPVRRDKLTGLYNRETFFERAAELIAEQDPGHYVLGCLDVNNFKVVNDRYGAKIGDEVLHHIALCLAREMSLIDGICCRTSADSFAAMYPVSRLESSSLETFHRDAINPPCIAQPISIRIGRYIVEDIDLPIPVLYDRAALAGGLVRGRPDVHVTYYEESMRERVLREQDILDNMRIALDEQQFEVWLQPHFNHATGACIGAEALLRWRHPEKGLLLPGDFIPVLERAGFVYEVDKFVWEQVCKYLRHWIDEGRDPLPISMNVSRLDLIQEGFLDLIVALPKRYGIPRDLMRIEITESAFAESTRHVIAVARWLVDNGFTVSIDDFGSGYSSLNTLKDVPAQILKLDMRFLEDEGNMRRGGNIIESVVRMAKWLGMSVIAEGVETKEQADFLKSIGCVYIQGFLYARAMPVGDYEKLAISEAKESELAVLETIDHLDTGAFWDPASMDSLIFNSYVGGACLLEYQKGSIELIRLSDKFINVIDSKSMTVEEALKFDWAGYLDKTSRAAMSQAIEKSLESGDEATLELLYIGLPGCHHETFLRTTLRVIASTGERRLVYCMNQNVTAQREAEYEVSIAAERLQAIMDNVGSGITALTIDDINPRFVFSNNRYYEIIGYTRTQFRDEVGNPFALVHPDDFEMVTTKTKMVNWTGMPETFDFRVVCRDESIIWVNASVTLMPFSAAGTPLQLCMFTDITSEKLAEQRRQSLLDNLPCGAGIYKFEDGAFSVAYVNDQYRSMVGRRLDDLRHAQFLEVIHPDDRQIMLDNLQTAIQKTKKGECAIRILHESGDYFPFHAMGRVVEDEDGALNLYVVYFPIERQASDVASATQASTSTCENRGDSLC